jgi:hypothetical protein
VAVDAAGNRAAAGFTVTVAFQFAGFSAPVDLGVVARTASGVTTCGTGLLDDLAQYATGGTSLRYDSSGAVPASLIPYGPGRPVAVIRPVRPRFLVSYFLNPPHCETHHEVAVVTLTNCSSDRPFSPVEMTLHSTSCLLRAPLGPIVCRLDCCVR